MNDVETTLRGCRVNFITHGGSVHHGIFRHVKPDGVLTLADEKGFLTEFDPSNVISIEDARSTCTRCSNVVNNVFGDPPLCAECYRDDARDRARTEERVFEEPCAKCGVKGAFYSPLAKEFRCTSCHLAAKSLTGLASETRAMAQLASCRTADVSDPRHEWVRVKGRRFRCRLCHNEKFGE